MTLEDDIRRDREAGTPGPMTPDFGEAFHVREPDGGSIAMMKFLRGRGGLKGKRDANEVAANLRRFCRTPDLEAAYLAQCEKTAKLEAALEKADALLAEERAYIVELKAALEKADKLCRVLKRDMGEAPHNQVVAYIDYIEAREATK